jgi:hypothetical protein
MIIAGHSAIQTVYSYGCGFAYELFGRINAPDSVKYFTALLNAVRGRLAHANRACPDHFLEPNPTPICLRHFPRSLASPHKAIATADAIHHDVIIITSPNGRKH